MTSQIAQLSQVEQQLNTNKDLEQLLSLYGQTQYNSVANYLGKEVEAPGNSGALIGGQGDFVYYLQDKPATLSGTRSDSTGNTVYTASGKQDANGNFVWTDAAGEPLNPQPSIPSAAGRNQFVWNGKNNNGQQQSDGTYTIAIDAKDFSGAAVASQTY